MSLISIQVKAVAAIDLDDLQDVLTSGVQFTHLGDEAVDHLLQDGDLIEVRTVGDRAFLTFIGVRQLEDTQE